MRRVAHARIHVAPVVGPELAQQDGPAMRLRPLLDTREIRFHLALFGVRAPCYARQIRGLPVPPRTLMGERHRQIVMHRHDDVAVIRRQLQRLESGDAVPERRADNDGPRRIRAGVILPFGSLRISNITFAGASL